MLELKNVYKTFNAGEQWGIFNKDVERIDIRTVSYEALPDFSSVESIERLGGDKLKEMLKGMGAKCG